MRTLLLYQVGQTRVLFDTLSGWKGGSEDNSTLNLIMVIFVSRKDVRLPVHLQRAMATEAEAAREARAKV